MKSDHLKDSVQAVSSRLGITGARTCLILGSGWSSAADFGNPEAQMDFTGIPGLGAPGTRSHNGTLEAVIHNGARTLVFKGRRHWYEGNGWLPVAIPVFIAKEFGVKHLVLTNSSGGIREDLSPGSLVAIKDHINFMGGNPLIDTGAATWGASFPDQSAVYPERLLQMLARCLDRNGASHEPAVYLGTGGPNYETPSEIGAFRRMGADLVGMSTVPEAILANAAGIEVGAVSLVSNKAAGISTAPLSHDEVIETGRRVVPRMKAFLTSLLDCLAGEYDD